MLIINVKLRCETVHVGCVLDIKRKTSSCQCNTIDVATVTTLPQPKPIVVVNSSPGAWAFDSCGKSGCVNTTQFYWKCWAFMLLATGIRVCQHRIRLWQPHNSYIITICYMRTAFSTGVAKARRASRRRLPTTRILLACLLTHLWLNDKQFGYVLPWQSIVHVAYRWVYVLITDHVAPAIGISDYSCVLTLHHVPSYSRTCFISHPS